MDYNPGLWFNICEALHCATNHNGNKSYHSSLYSLSKYSATETTIETLKEIRGGKKAGRKKLTG